MLSPSEGQVAYALLTRLPLDFSKASFQSVPFDLHVLSTPPAFVLSQDQTLHKIYEELNQALNYLLKKLPIAMLFIPIDVLIRSFHFSNIWL